MKEESSTEKAWRRWFPRKADENEVHALITRLNPSGTTEELVRILSGDTKEVSRFKHRLDQWLGRVGTDADTRLIEAITRKLQASSSAIGSAIELRQKWHDLHQLEERLKEQVAGEDRASQLARIEHDTKLLELEARKTELERRKKSLDSGALEDARAKLELKKIAAETAKLDADMVKLEAEAKPLSERPSSSPTPYHAKVMVAANADLSRLRREHASDEEIREYMIAKYTPDIELARKRGDTDAAEGFERELNKLLDSLARGEYRP